MTILRGDIQFLMQGISTRVPSASLTRGHGRLKSRTFAANDTVALYCFSRFLAGAEQCSPKLWNSIQQLVSYMAQGQRAFQRDAASGYSHTVTKNKILDLCGTRIEVSFDTNSARGTSFKSFHLMAGIVPSPRLPVRERTALR